MLLKPRDKFPQAGEHVLVEVKSAASDPNELLHRSFLFVDVDQKEKLRVVSRTPKIIMNIAGVPPYIQSDLLLDLLDWNCINTQFTGDEFFIGDDVLNQCVHGLDVLIDHLVDCVEGFITILVQDAVNTVGIRDV